MKKQFSEIQRESIAALLQRKQQLETGIIKERSKLVQEGRKNSNKIKNDKKQIARVETAICIKADQEESNEP